MESKESNPRHPLRAWKERESREQQAWLYMHSLETLSRSNATADAQTRAVPVVLSDFQTVTMTQPREQEELKRIQAHFMTIAQCAQRGLTERGDCENLGRHIVERMARYGASSDHIARRQVSVLTSRFVQPDSDSEWESVRRYGGLRTPAGEGLDERMTLFEEVACDVFERVYPDRNATPPDDIVHVSCSGYVSPSPVQTFLSRRGWLHTGVTHSYH